MRHGRLNKRFGRSMSERKELMRSLARNAIIYSRIRTTLPKAKQAARLLEKLITSAKKQTLQGARAVFDVLQDRSLVNRLVKEIAPLFKDINGGYTRIIRLNNRRGDGAQLAMLEFTKKIETPKKEKRPEKPKVQEAQKEKEEPKEKPKPVKEVKEKLAVKEKPVIKEEKPPAIKPEAKSAKGEISPLRGGKEEKKLKKEGWLDKIKGIFGKKKN